MRYNFIQNDFHKKLTFTVSLEDKEKPTMPIINHSEKVKQMNECMSTMLRGTKQRYKFWSQSIQCYLNPWKYNYSEENRQENRVQNQSLDTTIFCVRVFYTIKSQRVTKKSQKDIKSQSLKTENFINSVACDRNSNENRYVSIGLENKEVVVIIKVISVKKEESHIRVV